MQNAEDAQLTPVRVRPGSMVVLELQVLGPNCEALAPETAMQNWVVVHEMDVKAPVPSTATGADHAVPL